MQVSYEEDLANHFGLQRRGVSGNRFVLSVRAKGNAGQPLSSEITTSVCRSCPDLEKATSQLPQWQGSYGHGGVCARVRLVIQILMNSFCVVKGFDILEYAQTRFIEILKLFELGPFVFQRPEEAFNNGVVVATSCSTHRASDACGSHDLLKRFAGVLATAIAMVDQLFCLRLS